MYADCGMSKGSSVICNEKRNQGGAKRIYTKREGTGERKKKNTSTRK